MSIQTSTHTRPAEPGTLRTTNPWRLAFGSHFGSKCSLALGAAELHLARPHTIDPRSRSEKGRPQAARRLEECALRAHFPASAGRRDQECALRAPWYTRHQRLRHHKCSEAAPKGRQRCWVLFAAPCTFGTSLQADWCRQLAEGEAVR